MVAGICGGCGGLRRGGEYRRIEFVNLDILFCFLGEKWKTKEKWTKS